MASDWLSDLSPSEMKQWEEFAEHTRKKTLPNMENSKMVMSLVPKGKTDVKFNVELGSAIMMDKPIVLLVMPNTTIPVRLARVADAIIELHSDLDTEEGQAEMASKLKPVFEEFM